jgi:hypothetical protein
MGLAVAVTSLAAPALATPPDSWPEGNAVSPLDFLLVIAIIPLALVAVITLLALLPSMTRSGTTYQPGLAWRNEPEWFGGRREIKDDDDTKAVTGAEPEPAGERGGASARW